MELHKIITSITEKLTPYKWLQTSFNLINSKESHSKIQKLALDHFLKHPESPRSALRLLLLKAKLLSEQNLKAARSHKNVFLLKETLEYLLRAEILDQENLIYIVNHTDLKDLKDALKLCYENQLLNNKNFQILASYTNVKDVISMHNILHRRHLFNLKNFQKMIEHKDYEYFGAIVCFLSKNNLINQATFDISANHTDTESLYFILHDLDRNKILNEHNFLLTIQHANPQQLYKTVTCLYERDLLDAKSKNFLSIINHPDSTSLYKILERLYPLRRLEQDYLNDCFQFCSMLNDASDRLPQNLWTMPVFNQLITFCKENNAKNKINKYVNELIQDENKRNFNPMQSTHTASVHASVSLSALKLAEQYSSQRKKWDSTKILKQIKRSNTNPAIHRFLLKIRDPIFCFQDPVSNLSIQKILGIAWLAIHDDQNREGTLEDARNLFMQGLYEIQRGGNLDPDGQDLYPEDIDVPICASGTFNKIIEKLHGIHKLVEIKYVSKDAAGIKFPIVVKEELQNYLDHLSEEDRISAIKELKKDGTINEKIWEEIYNKVYFRMSEEFSSCFANEQDFSDLINNGEYVDLEEFLQNFQN
jgi:hypothetical protein